VLSLTLGALRSNTQRLELVKAIEKYAPEAHIEADVLSALAPPTESSYTELWLSSLASAPQREKLTPLSAGHTLKSGEYAIDARHGSGGQGVTYLAHKIADKQHQSPHHLEAEGAEDESNLVVKETILPIYVDSQHRRDSVEHFEKDARLLLRLEHPHLVQLRDYFIEDHRAYLVLDRVRGQNLRQLVETRGRLQPSEVLGLARQMCEILSYLHAQQPEIIHRDFTPENLMLDQVGQLKLIDFGVAHELKSRTTATVVGKHAYLPPEQFRGKPCSQSDLYALGATLYFLLTGTDPEPLSRLNPLNNSDNNNDDNSDATRYDLSEEEKDIFAILCRAIEHATELDISQRTASAADVLAELKEGAVIVIKTTNKGDDWAKISNRKSDAKLIQTPQAELTNG
jgi:serine/threonine protein kinase